jgi:hypothetical protein
MSLDKNDIKFNILLNIFTIIVKGNNTLFDVVHPVVCVIIVNKLILSNTTMY